MSKETDNRKKDEVYEHHDGDYEGYNPKYASYLKTSNTHHRVICQKLAKKKWVILVMVTFLAICGIAVGLSIHFTAPKTSSIATAQFVAPTASMMVTLEMTTSKGISIIISCVQHTN